MRAWQRVGTVLAVALAAGCSSRSVVESGIGSTAPLTVASVRARGPYLDVLLQGDGVGMRIFAFAGDPACREVLAPEEQAVYAARGAGGRFTRGELVCNGAGIGDPFVGRLRQPRGLSAGSDPIPRAQATFSTLYEDEEVVMLRGRFPLAFHVGWSGGQDSVAVVANSPQCSGPVSRGVASMEYRPAGRNTLTLVGRAGPCRIDGLAMPPPGPDPNR